MTLAEIQEMWKEDCTINPLDLGAEATNVPKLHAKYLQLLTTVRLKLRKVEVECLRMRRTKERYYRGELSKEELAELGWEQYLFNKPLRNELEGILAMDDEMILLQDKVEYYKTMLNLLDQIMKSINGRTWEIRAAIDWAKFTNGGF